MKLHVVLKDKWTGGHVRRTIFMGPDREHVALTGSLVMGPGEYIMFDSIFREATEDCSDMVKIYAPNRKEVTRAILDAHKEAVSLFGKDMLKQLTQGRKKI